MQGVSTRTVVKWWAMSHGRTLAIQSRWRSSFANQWAGNKDSVLLVNIIVWRRRFNERMSIEGRNNPIYVSNMCWPWSLFILLFILLNSGRTKEKWWTTAWYFCSNRLTLSREHFLGETEMIFFFSLFLLHMQSLDFNLSVAVVSFRFQL